MDGYFVHTHAAAEVDIEGGHREVTRDRQGVTHVIAHPTRKLKFFPLGGTMEVHVGASHTGSRFAQGGVTTRVSETGHREESGGFIPKVKMGLIRGQLPMSRALSQVNVAGAEPWTAKDLLARVEAHPSYGKSFTFVSTEPAVPPTPESEAMAEDEKVLTAAQKTADRYWGMENLGNGKYRCNVCEREGKMSAKKSHSQGKKHQARVRKLRAIEAEAQKPSE